MRSWFLILLISGLILAGCAPPEDVITLTPRIVPTATAVPTRMVTAVPTETATSIDIVTSVPIKPPVTESTQEGTISSNDLTSLVSSLYLGAPHELLPEVQLSNASYELKPPDTGLLLELLVMHSYRTHRAAIMQSATQISTPFEQLILEDINLYFGGELPNASHLVRYDSLHFSEQVAEPLESNWKMIRTGIVQYLNEAHMVFEAGVERQVAYMRINPHAVDLNHDSVSDWLLQVQADGHSISLLIPLITKPDGAYELIANDFPAESTNILYENEVFLDHDLTGDGQPDVIWYTRSYSGRGYFEEIRTFSWSGQKLEMLTTIDLSRSAGAPIPQFAIGDFNDDRADDIRISTEDIGNFDCHLEGITIYSWPNATVHEERNSHLSTPACYIWKSIYATPEDAVTWLQLALVEWMPTDVTDASLIALSRLHLAMAQTAIGQTTEAQATLNELYNLPIDIQFVQSVLQAYESAGKRPLQTCRNLMANGVALLETEIGHFLSWNAADPYMVTWGGVDGTLPHLPTICNYGKTVEYLVINSVIPTAQSPVDFLAAQDIHYEFAIPYNLDDDPELEWIGIIKLQWPVLLVFDSVDGAWQPKIKRLYLDEVTDFVIAAADVTEDGQEDVIGLVTGTDYCYELEIQTNYQDILMLYTEDPSARFAGKTLSCIQEQDELIKIYDITEVHFERNPIAIDHEWEMLTEFSATPDSLYGYIEELQTAVLTQTDPTVPTQITDLLDYLPTDDPEARPYREHLTYLLGYYYELSGDAETAVSTYLTLIQQAPSSPWAWLAWARLEPVISGDN